MVINLVEGTTNVLKDNGSSELDGCIYSSGKLTIEGKGSLEVYGYQEEGEGIATTDVDITINGSSYCFRFRYAAKTRQFIKSKEYYFTLNSKTSSGSSINLKDSSGNEVASFEAKEDFKTLIISNEKLSNNTYYLYINGEKTNYSQTIK